jgi:hypothetical protein
MSLDRADLDSRTEGVSRSEARSSLLAAP